jgi:hypothetical protein
MGQNVLLAEVAFEGWLFGSALRHEVLGRFGPFEPFSVVLYFFRGRLVSVLFRCILHFDCI